MSGRAQERLEKLKSNLRASVAAKQENVAVNKTSGVKTKKREHYPLALPAEKPKKVQEPLSQMRQGAKASAPASQKRQEPPVYCQQKKTHESFTDMRLKKALQNAQTHNYLKSAGAHTNDNLDSRASAQHRLRKLKRKRPQNGTGEPGQKHLSAVLPETRSSQPVLQRSDFKIPRKPKEISKAAETKSDRTPSSLYNSSESINNVRNGISTASELSSNGIPPNFEKSATKQNLAGILVKMRPTSGSHHHTITGNQRIRSNKRKDESAQVQNDQNQIVNACRDLPVEVQKNSTVRNMYKRKEHESVPNLKSEGAHTQSRPHLDQNPSQSSHGFSREPNEKQQHHMKQRNTQLSQSVKPCYQGDMLVPQGNPNERNMAHRRKAPVSNPELASETRTQSRSHDHVPSHSSDGFLRDFNQKQLPTKQLNDQTVQPSSLNVQRNLFKRKAPGSVPDLSDPARTEKSNQVQISTQASQRLPRESNKKLQPTKQKNSHKPNHDQGGGGIREIVSRAYKGVVNAVKETAYYCSRSEVSKELQTVRRAVEPVEAMDYEITCPTFEDEQTPLVQTDLYLVVDTNVVIDNLALIKNLKTRKVKGMTPKIVVPWQVLKELDYLKESKNRMDAVMGHARKGIRYLLDEICKYEFISGQPQHAALRELENFQVEIPDDHIIKCCLQLKCNGHNVMLLTNDKNLVIKGVVNGVPSMKCEDFIESCPNNEAPQTLSPFESPPAGTFAPDLLPIANAAHQMAVLLKNFLNAVLKKFLKYRFQNLWMLRIPGTEPWSLTTLLETIIDYWNELVAKYGAQTNAKDTLLFLRRFIHKVAYERLRYAEVDQFARSCHQLAVALPHSFGVEGVCFDNRLAFWKCPAGTDPPADVTFCRSCVNLTIHHMQLFENNAVQYCFCVSKSLEVPFSHPKITSCYLGSVDCSNLPKIITTVKVMGEALAKISSIPLGSVVKSSDGVQALYSSLITSLGDAADMRFFVDDVVEFCNDSEIRRLFPDALQSLEVIASFLAIVLRRTPKLT